MKFIIVFAFFTPACLAQDVWKNIYSQPAWEARDAWQKADELIRLLDLSEGSRVADIGSHEGYMSFKLARRVGREGKVYSVDLLQERLDKLKRLADANGLSQIETIKGEAADPHLPANALDAVLILDTYHEMREHDAMLQHIKSALKEGGRLVICEPIADSRRSLSRGEQEKKHELAIEFALKDLTKAGFKISFHKDNFIDRREEKGDWMWVIVARKNSH